MIAAVARGGVIGRGGRLPWRLPDDLKHFRERTLGKTLLMGRRTYESIGRPLDGRKSIVVSRDPAFSAPGCTVVRSIEEGLAKSAPHGETVVVGGAELYAQLLRRADRLYLTWVHADVAGDTRFPEIDLSEWREVAREDHGADERHAHAFSFVVLERSRPGRERPPAAGLRGLLERARRLFRRRRLIRHPPRDPR